MLQIELIQLDRVKNAIDHLEETDPSVQWKASEPSRHCVLQFHVYSPGLKIDDAVDAVEELEGITLYSCSRSGQAYSMVFQTDFSNWRQVKKLLHKALKPLENNVPQIDNTPDPTLGLEHHRFCIFVGYGLVAMVNDLMPAIANLRAVLSSELGFIFPTINVRDNMELKSSEYQFQIDGVVVAGGEVFVNEKLVINSEKFEHGTLVKDPVYGVDARWITPEHEGAAQEAGLTIVSPLQVILSHLAESIRTNGGDLLRRQQVYFLVDRLRSCSPELVKEVVPRKMQIHQLHFLLQHLLKAGKSIKDLERIFEAIGSCETKQIELYFAHVINKVYT